MRERGMLRGLILALPLLLAVAPASAAEKTYRMGVLAVGDAAESLSSASALFRATTLPGLAEQGFIEGQNLVVFPRYGADEELDALARELATLRLDVIVAVSGRATRAAVTEAPGVPIVMSFIGEDPVAAGFAVSLARPGKHVTGIVMLSPELNAKRLHLLYEAVPQARRVAVLEGPPARRTFDLEAMRAVAARFGGDTLFFKVTGPDEYEEAFRQMRSAGIEALAVMSSPVLYRDTERITALAAQARLPTICEWREMAQRGCVLGYGPSLTGMRRRTADQIARIFRGTPAAEIPIEQPTQYEFAVNLRAARAVGAEIEGSMLIRADELIE